VNYSIRTDRHEANSLFHNFANAPKDDDEDSSISSSSSSSTGGDGGRFNGGSSSSFIMNLRKRDKTSASQHPTV
jgi:hypothetical protein